jgi:hypothetical protein
MMTMNALLIALEKIGLDSADSNPNDHCLGSELRL